MTIQMEWVDFRLVWGRRSKRVECQSLVFRVGKRKIRIFLQKNLKIARLLLGTAGKSWLIPRYDLGVEILLISLLWLCSSRLCWESQRGSMLLVYSFVITSRARTPEACAVVSGCACALAGGVCGFGFGRWTWGTWLSCRWAVWLVVVATTLFGGIFFVCPMKKLTHKGRYSE